MAQIELAQVEMVLLQEILQSYLSGLNMEIAYADRKDFRGFIKERRKFIEDFIQRLEKELASGKREMISMDRLREVEIFQGLAEGELQGIAPFFHEENVAAGVSLCEEGARAQQIYILEQGSVSLSSKKFGRLEINTPGKIVGWPFLVPPYRYTASAATTSLCKFLVIKSPDLYYLIHKEPKIEVKVMDNLAQIMANRFKGAEHPANR